MNQAKPRFIIEVISQDKPWVKRRGTTKAFQELDQIKPLYYERVLQEKDFIIYERKCELLERIC